MIYRQSFDANRLRSLQVDLALDYIRAELAENLLNVNNAYCDTKIATLGDVFVKYPASNNYDSSIEGIIDVANKVINLGYSTIDSPDDYKESVLEAFLNIRTKLMEDMEALPQIKE